MGLVEVATISMIDAIQGCRCVLILLIIAYSHGGQNAELKREKEEGDVCEEFAATK